MDYEQHTDRLVAYPGNVISLTRKVRPVSIIFARLVDETGTPIPNAFLEFNGSTLGTTGPDGFFQIDASPGDTIIARRSVEKSCELVLPTNSNPTNAYIDAGTLSCL
ncbi:MAG: CS1-pili formation C-terminal domain-containing protein [Henriciella sp.]|nr:CS1-pili formation C-terminal domain-containing protein [Henriciella sp.]